MQKLRKMIGKLDSPSTEALVRLIETQNKTTIGLWCINYALDRVLPIWERHQPKDTRARDALETAKKYVVGHARLDEVKRCKRECKKVPDEFAKDPILLASSRAIFDAALQSVYSPSGALSFLWYASAAIAYDRLGLEASSESLDALAEIVTSDYTSELRAISVENEPNPAKVSWTC
ncbi:MAG: hypothetical protein LBT59_05135 [Clostridiales bacterium]|nr:hypothetical protein [Clostridiales bacterium]